MIKINIALKKVALNSLVLILMIYNIFLIMNTYMYAVKVSFNIVYWCLMAILASVGIHIFAKYGLKINTFTIWIVVFLLYLSVSLIWINTPIETMKYIIEIIIFWFGLITINFCGKRKINLLYTYKILSLICFIVIIFREYIFGFSFPMINFNFIAGLSSINLIMTYVSTERMGEKIIYILLNIITITLINSLDAIISIVLVFLWILLKNLLKNRTKLKYVSYIYLAMPCILSFMSIKFYFNEYLAINLLNGRQNIWLFASKYSNIFGNGINSWNYYVNAYGYNYYIKPWQKIYALPGGTHNIYWQTYFELGIVGIVLLFCLVFYLFNKSFNNNNYVVIFLLIFMLYYGAGEASLNIMVSIGNSLTFYYWMNVFSYFDDNYKKKTRVSRLKQQNLSAEKLY